MDLLNIDEGELELLIDGLLALFDINEGLINNPQTVERTSAEWVESLKEENKRVRALLDDLFIDYPGWEARTAYGADPE